MSENISEQSKDYDHVCGVWHWLWDVPFAHKNVQGLQSPHSLLGLPLCGPFIRPSQHLLIKTTALYCQPRETTATKCRPTICHTARWSFGGFKSTKKKNRNEVNSWTDVHVTIRTIMLCTHSQRLQTVQLGIQKLWLDVKDYIDCKFSNAKCEK